MLNLQINIVKRREKSKWEALVSVLFCTYLNLKQLLVFQGICCGFVCGFESRCWRVLPVVEDNS